MIGQNLTHKEQMNILAKLDKTDIPWNCAHGRPTMSHIRSLVETLLEDDDCTERHIGSVTMTI